MSSAAPAVPGTAVVIEDEADVRALIAQILVGAGFTVVEAPTGMDGIAAVEEHRPELITLDVNMPGIDGFETARRIRALSKAYIVFITALNDEADVVLGFSAGADDVVIKPFRVRELRARLEALLRRQRPMDDDGDAAPASPASPAADDSIRHGDLVVEISRRTATLDGEPVVLTRTEFDLLVILLEAAGEVRSRADLVLAVRDEGYLGSGGVTDADEHAIGSHITNLRRKLGETGAEPRFIETVRGIGYRATPTGNGQAYDTSR
ncbi:MAG: response regulator transcription factor [Microbacterium sp.]|uniref:response regulator transcription factor n=1 Tax=Microbacterium sp. TaxID=51671 RepID=UPI0039E602C3